MAITILAGLALFIMGFILGLWRGARLGIRIFGKDAITLAFRTLDANPEKFAEMKAEALNYPDHETWIQETLERVGSKPKPYNPRDEWEAEKKRLHDQGIT